MYGRQKVLLYAVLQLEKHNIPISKTYLDKFLFILSKESKINECVKFYSFYPNHYGPFSNQFYLDIADLQSGGLINDKLHLTSEEPMGWEISKKAMRIVDYAIEGFLGKNLIDYVYGKYPEYIVRSRLMKHTAVKEEPGIFSIGYEGHNIDSFLDILIQNRIDAVADLRYNPFSMNLAFTKSRLLHYLNKAGIEYLHMPELGIEGSYRKNLEKNEDYERLFDFYSKELLPKQWGKVKDIAEMGKGKRVAMLCFEHDKNHCHRGVVSSELEKGSVMVKHL
ncbi:MAG: DUF488 family protein [Candidatus Micrarchaeota archaeon]|nr:DUF488 family protein [Candidatus Micrarchaeota archaeon]